MSDINDRIIPITPIGEQIVIYHFNDRRDNVIVLKNISREEYLHINTHKTYVIDSPFATNNGKKEKIVISNENIYAAGTVDVNDENDIKCINDFNFVGDLIDCPSMIPAGFNFKENNIKIRNGTIKYTPTSNALEWFKYNYARIGKPEYIIIFKIEKMYLKHCNEKH